MNIFDYSPSFNSTAKPTYNLLESILLQLVVQTRFDLKSFDYFYATTCESEALINKEKESQLMQILALSYFWEVEHLIALEAKKERAKRQFRY